jgi:hypothetical protein
MKLRWLAVTVLSAGIGLGCSQDIESSPPHSSLETLSFALGERDELERTYLLTSFLRTLRPEDMPLALAEVEKNRAGVDADEVRLFMLAWTRFDGPGAFATARDWPTPWKTILMEQAMQAWGYNDGRAALAESEQIEDEELREKLQIALVSGWISSHDRLGASEFAATISEPRRRTRLALRLAGEAKRDGVEAVIAWADAVPEDAPNDFKEAVFSHAAGVITRLDPERVTTWYEGQMEHAYTSFGLRSIAGKWAQFHDPKALITWLDSLPIEEARESERVGAVGMAFRTWAPLAPEEAEAWLESASDGPTRDVAIDEFARATVDADPTNALHWVGQITDYELRRKRTLRYTRLWFAQDPDAAETWLETADIPKAWQKQIMNNMPHAKSRAKAANIEQGK